MAISINWATKVITIPVADLTLVSGTLYELDVDVLRLALKDIEDSEEGVNFPDTHRHNTSVTLSGVTYARTFEIINGYTVTFQDVGTPYTVRCVGANHNIADVKNVNQVSLVVGNSAGLIAVSTTGSVAPTESQIKSWVREELATEMARIDVPVSTGNMLYVLPTGFTFRQALDILTAYAAGKTTGSPSTTVFKSIDGLRNVILGVSDTNGMRTSATLTPS